MGLINQDLNADVYDEYIEKIVSIFRLSSKKSSILFDMKIENYSATIKLSILKQNGERERFHDKVLTCDSVFYRDFLMKLVQKVYEDGEIATADVVRLSEGDLVTFRMITTNNDLFSIDGLSSDDANALLALCKNSDTSSEKTSLINREGKGSLWIFLLIIVVVFVSFGVIILYS